MATNNRDLYMPIMQQASAKYGVPLALMDAIFMRESKYNPTAKGPTNDAGIPQFIPATARNYDLIVGGGIDERLIPAKAIPAAAAYIADVAKAAGGYSDWGKIGMGYNAGPKAVNYKNPSAGVANYRDYMRAAQGGKTFTGAVSTGAVNTGGGSIDLKDINKLLGAPDIKPAAVPQTMPVYTAVEALPAMDTNWYAQQSAWYAPPAASAYRAPATRIPKAGNLINSIYNGIDILPSIYRGL